MTNILKFPGKTRYSRIRIRAKARHSVWLRVTDRQLADVIRTQAQYAIARGCGFRGLKGWTNETARRRRWFRCTVRTQLLARFLMDLELAVRADGIAVEVDGRPVRLAA